MIARKSVLVLLQNLAGAALGIVAVKVTSVYLGKSVIGEFQAAIGFLGLLFFLTDLGFGQAHTKRVSEGMDPRDCLATFAAFKIVVTTLFAATVLGVMAFRLFVLEKSLDDAAPTTLLVVLAYYVVKSVSAIPASTFDALRETARGQMMQFVETLVRVGLTIPVALLIGAAVRGAGPFAGSAVAGSPLAAWAQANPATFYALAWTGGALVSLGVGLLYLHRSTAFGRVRLDILKSYWTYALPIFLVAGIQVVSVYIDKAALAYFWSDVELGRFSQPRTVTGFLENVPAAVVLLLFPTVSAFHAAGRHAEIEETTERAERYVAMIVVPAVVVILVYPEAVIRVGLSGEWLDAVTTIRLLAVYSLLIGLTRPAVAVLLGVGRPGAAAAIGVTMAAVNIVLVLLLVPPSLRIVPVPLPGLADVGAALASVGSAVVGLVMFRRAARRPLLSRTLAVQLAAGIVMAGALVLLAAPLEAPMRWFHLAGFSLVGCAVYLAVLVAAKDFTRADREFFRSALHVGDLVGYVRSELRGRRRP